MSERKLRLVLFEDCHRSCAGCCNNDFDLNSLETVDGYKDYDLIMLTGGEPMLKPEVVCDVLQEIRETSDAKVYMYTTKTKKPSSLMAMLFLLDGITVTLHEQYDVEPFRKFNELLMYLNIDRSLRLNVFKGVNLLDIDTHLWTVKKDIEWIVNCPLPEGEVLKKLWD